MFPEKRSIGVFPTPRKNRAPEEAGARENTFFLPNGRKKGKIPFLSMQVCAFSGTCGATCFPGPAEQEDFPAPMRESFIPEACGKGEIGESAAGSPRGGKREEGRPGGRGRKPEEGDPQAQGDAGSPRGPSFPREASFLSAGPGALQKTAQEKKKRAAGGSGRACPLGGFPASSAGKGAAGRGAFTSFAGAALRCVGERGSFACSARRERGERLRVLRRGREVARLSRRAAGGRPKR